MDLNEFIYCDRRLDLDFEIEFFIESYNELDYLYIYRGGFFLYFSVNIIVYCVLFSCSLIFDIIFIIVKFIYRW